MGKFVINGNDTTKITINGALAKKFVINGNDLTFKKPITTSTGIAASYTLNGRTWGRHLVISGDIANGDGYVKDIILYGGRIGQVASWEAHYENNYDRESNTRTIGLSDFKSNPDIINVKVIFQIHYSGQNDGQNQWGQATWAAQIQHEFIRTGSGNNDWTWGFSPLGIKGTAPTGTTQAQGAVSAFMTTFSTWINVGRHMYNPTNGYYTNYASYRNNRTRVSIVPVEIIFTERK